VLGAVTVGVGATFWFFSRRINQSLALSKNLVEVVGNAISGIESGLSNIPGYTPSNLAQSVYQAAPTFDPTFSEFKQRQGLVGYLGSVPVYTYIMVIGFAIMFYSVIRMERWFEPKQAFVSYQKE
jgi:hypothetical protein